MTSPASLSVPSRSLAVPQGSALSHLPRHQGLWIVGQVLAAELSWWSGLWGSSPEIALVLCIAAGAALASPWRLWAAPLVFGGVVLVGMGFHWMQWPTILGACAAAGGLASWLLPWRTDWLDAVNGALATLVGGTVGLLFASQWLIPGISGAVGTGMAIAVTGLFASLGLLPLVLRFDAHPDLPTSGQICRHLTVPYRPPAQQAVALFRACTRQLNRPWMDRSDEADTERGLAEVATWVFRLQVTLQTLDREVETIRPAEVQARIERCQSGETADPFTAERQKATISHLERLLEHRAAIVQERERTGAIVDYALAFLEEARAGLAVARELPGEAVPDRLATVLHRLRSQAREGDNRRRTKREIDDLDQT